MSDYQLLDSGFGQKWERFGEVIVQRPCPQAIWRPTQQIEADAIFSRDGEKGWALRKKIPKAWHIVFDGVILQLALTDFGHLGVFPEHAAVWQWMCKQITKGMNILNLFAYSGAATLAAAQSGASVCHLDASKGIVQWARENCALNHLDKAPIRWIVDDALKFLKREVRRGVRYDGILLDPPTFGRGSKGEVFKIERDLLELLELCAQLQPRFCILSCHTPGLTALALSHIMGQVFSMQLESSEMVLSSPGTFGIPCGSVVRAWTKTR